MTRTLLVEIEVEDPGILPELSLEVQSILNENGITTLSVRPWSPPNAGPTL